MRIISSVKTIECLTGTMYSGSDDVFRKCRYIIVSEVSASLSWYILFFHNLSLSMCFLQRHLDTFRCLYWLAMLSCTFWRWEGRCKSSFFLFFMVLSGSEIIIRVCFVTFCVAITDNDVVMKQRVFLYFLLLFRYKELFKTVDAFSVGVF